MKSILIIAILSIINLSHGQTLKEQLAQKANSGKGKPVTKEKKIMMRAAEDLKKLHIEEKALKKGEKLPEFFLGGKSINKLKGNKKLVLKFYRGGWCPYCMLELKEYQRLIKKFESSGAVLVFLAPDTNKEIAKTKKKFSLTMPIFQDKDNKIAEKLGLVFKLPKDLVEVYKGFNLDLANSQGNTDYRLPVPATYVIDEKGIVTYSFVDTDYRKRAEPTDVLKQL